VAVTFKMSTFNSELKESVSPQSKKGIKGYVTAPDSKVVEQAKLDAKKLFPNDETAQRNYWLKKGASTMQIGIMEVD